MSDGGRSYVSPKREAQAAATREAILEAFAEQVADGRDQLSPSEAAVRAGVSARTVHSYFPNREIQIIELGQWFDRTIFKDGVIEAQGPDDLPRYFREVHRMALASPVAKAWSHTAMFTPEIRQRRRTGRLAAIRRSVEAIGAPLKATADATAVLLALSGANASWSMHDLYGLPLDRIPDAIAHTVQLVVDDLRRPPSKRGWA